MKLCTVDGCGNAFSCKGYCNKHYLRFKKYGTPEPGKPTFEERFWAKVEKTESCWNWTAGTFATGYGSFDSHKRAHRVAYELLVGEIPDGMVLDHVCHNRRCVNPGHLRVATVKQNTENFTKLLSSNTSGYRGVTQHKASGLWMAITKHDGNRTVTYHKTKLQAADAARQQRLAMHSHNDLDRRAA
jgi:hypothetical protein